MQFFLPSQKITIPEHNIKKEKVSLVNASWVVSRILCILFNVNQIKQFYLSNNEASCHHITVMILTGKIC